MQVWYKTAIVVFSHIMFDIVTKYLLAEIDIKTLATLNFMHILDKKLKIYYNTIIETLLHIFLIKNTIKIASIGFKYRVKIISFSYYLQYRKI